MIASKGRCLFLIGLVILALTPAVDAQQLPSTIKDDEFWRLINDLSETGGVFPQQFMSNEDSALFVIPALKETTKRGGVYVGVGSEQNFTYIAAIQPRLAFVVDIRRDNVFEHLMYKALFELSENRADFVSRLFSRKRPAGIDNAVGVRALFDAFRPVEADATIYETTLRAVMDRLNRDHGFSLTDAERHE